MSKLKIIEHPYQVQELIHHCQTTKTCSFDYETSSFEFQDPNQIPLICGVSFQPGSSWIIPLEHKDSPFLKTWRKHFKLFGREVLENPEIDKVAWNLKFEYKWSLRIGYILKGRIFDAMLAKYCLDEERPHDLKDFSAMMFPEYANYEDEMRKGPYGRLKWRDKPLEPLSKYCGIDSDLTLRGWVYLEPRLIKLGFYNFFRNMLMGITRVLAEGEYKGIKTDRKYLLNLIDQYKIKLKDSDTRLRNTPALIKYERRYKKQHLEDLVEAVRNDIEKVKEEGKGNVPVLISNREKKITRILSGQLTGKEQYEGFNFDSPKQMAQFLFSSPLGLKLKCPKKTKKGADSSSEEVLLLLKPKDKSGFMDNLLLNRGLQKLDSTYISGMLPHLDRYDYVHAGFKINGTVTGRLSCVKPNLQNIPRDTTASDIKKMFIPPPGYLLVEVDYSQAELRLIAEVSEDKAMIDIFRRDYNIHVATACKMKNGLSTGNLDQYDKVKKLIKMGDELGGAELDKPENAELLFWQKQKKKGKSMNFSIVYQQGDDATAEQMGISKDEAKLFKREWFKAFPGVEKWIKRQKAFAHKHEFVYNIFGTKRRLPDINDDRTWISAEAERQAINAPIQGASGYFTLFSMVVMREKILTGEFPADMVFPYTVHDSIGIYLQPKDIHRVMPRIITICDNPETEKYFGFNLKHVKMKVSPEVGKRWEGLRGYDPNEDYSKWLKN